MRLSYPANVKVVQVPCSGRVDIVHLLKAVESGADAGQVARRISTILTTKSNDLGFESISHRCFLSIEIYEKDRPFFIYDPAVRQDPDELTLRFFK